MNSGSSLVRCHDARKPEIAIHASGAIDKESDARIAALKLVVGDLNHLHAVDVDRYDVSNHCGLHRVTILNPILRTSHLLQVGELSQRPFPPGDIAIGLGSSEHRNMISYPVQLWGETELRSRNSTSSQTLPSWF